MVVKEFERSGSEARWVTSPDQLDTAVDFSAVSMVAEFFSSGMSRT